MKVSLHTIKQLIDFELPSVEVLVDKINRQLGGVEEVIDLGQKYKDTVIVKVVFAEKHPNADRLSVCLVDDGGVVKHVERDSAGLVKVVCGAPNVTAGMYAVWLPPKATVPASYGDVQPFVLDAREIRGEMSNGMLAAADELAIGSDHSGIIEINPEESLPSKVEIKPGVSFAKAFGLDDYVIDIENKMFTHRPDLFGQLGVAREIAGILGHQFTSPSWYIDIQNITPDTTLPLRVVNNAKDNVPRFMAMIMKDVAVRPSPLWLQCALVAMGSKPISNIVDLTNYIMLMTAQPTHAYDYDKLRGNSLGVRMAKKGETATLLNGKTYTLSAEDIVIVDGDGVVGLGGIMGGGNSEVSSTTKTIVLEVATFDMYAVRKTSMRHGLFTDALSRFNKGQSPLQNPYVLSALASEITRITGALPASALFDESKKVEKIDSVDVSATFINQRLGLSLSSAQVRTLLANVEVHTSVKGDHLIVAPAFWRRDIEIAEDVVEEVGRLYGFDKLPRELPVRSLKPAPKNIQLTRKQELREILRLAGASEVLTYSFVHEKVMARSLQDTSYAYKLSNALSPDLQYYRLSLTPSLLDKIHMNSKAGNDEFALFEINKVHLKNEMDDNEPAVPREESRLALVVVGNKKKDQNAAYYRARTYVEQVLPLSNDSLVRLDTINLAKDRRMSQLVAPYDQTRSAAILIDKQIIGVVGEFREEVTKAFKLPELTAGFEILTNSFQEGSHKVYRPLSKYPSITQDISLRVASTVKFADLRSIIEKVTTTHSAHLLIEIEPLTIYQSSDESYKTISFRITVTSYQKTLSDKDVNKIMAEIEKAAAESVKAERI